MGAALIDSFVERRKRRARNRIDAMRGLVTAFLAMYASGGVFSAAAIDPSRALSGKTTAKTTTAKTV